MSMTLFSLTGTSQYILWIVSSFNMVSKVEFSKYDLIGFSEGNDFSGSQDVTKISIKISNKL